MRIPARSTDIKCGDLGLHDRSNAPIHQSIATSTGIMAEIEPRRRTRKRSALGITFEHRTNSVVTARRPFTKILRNLGSQRRRFIAPIDRRKPTEKPQVIIAKRQDRWSTSPSRNLRRSPKAAVGAFTAVGPSRSIDPSAGKRRTSEPVPVTPTYLPRNDGNTRLAYTDASITKPPQQLLISLTTPACSPPHSE